MDGARNKRQEWMEHIEEFKVKKMSNENRRKIFLNEKVREERFLLTIFICETVALLERLF